MSFVNTLQDIDNASTNLTDVHSVATLAALFATTDFIWHEGDVAIVAGGAAVGDLPGKGTYVYRGTDQTTAGTTVANDWLHLTTPTDAVESVAGQTGVISKSDLLTAINVDDGADVTPAWVPNTNPNYLTGIPTDVIRDGDFTVTDNEAVSVNINGAAVPFVGSTQLPTDPTAYPAGVQNSQIPNASTSQTGLLTSTDWQTFNGKQAAGNYLTSIPTDATAYPAAVQNANLSGEDMLAAINGQNNRLNTARIGTGVLNNAELNTLNNIDTTQTIQAQFDTLMNAVGVEIRDFPTSGSTYPFTVTQFVIYESSGVLYLRTGADVEFANFGAVVLPTQGNDWHELPGSLPTSASAYPTGLQNSQITLTSLDAQGTIDSGNASSVRSVLNVADGADVTPSWVPDTNPNYLTTVAYGDITGTKPPSNADVTPSWVPETNPNYLAASTAVTVQSVTVGDYTVEVNGSGASQRIRVSVGGTAILSSDKSGNVRANDFIIGGTI